MLLVVDIGNTNINLGAYDNDRLVFVSRISTDRSKTRDQYAVELKSIFSLHNADSLSFSGSVVGSVVPELTHENTTQNIASYISAHETSGNKEMSKFIKKVQKNEERK